MTVLNQLTKLLDLIGTHMIMYAGEKSSEVTSTRTPMDLELLFPDLHANDPDTLAEALLDQTKVIKRQFASLILHLKKDLDEKAQSDQGLFMNIICFLRFYDSDLEAVLLDCTSSAEVFNKLSKFVSFFDYDIAKDLVGEFGSDAMKDEMQQYIRSFEEFAKRRVCECPVNAFGEPGPSSEVLVLKTDKIIDKLTVVELKRLTYEIKKILGSVMRVLRVEKGCVKITFRVLKKKCVSEDQKCALNQLGVENISSEAGSIMTAQGGGKSLKKYSNTCTPC